MFESPGFCDFYFDLKRFEFERSHIRFGVISLKNAVILRILRYKTTLPDPQVSSTCSNWVGSFTHTCPPPSVGKQEIYAVWRQARAEEAQRRTAPPKKISFDRRKFAPYLEKLGSDKELEELFLAFLRQRVG